MTLSRRTAAGGLSLVVVLASTLTTTLTVTLAAMVMPVLPAKGLAILVGVAFNYIASHFVFHARLKRFGGGEVPG